MTARPHGDLHDRVESLVRQARDAALAVLARDGSAAEPSRIEAGAVVALAEVLDVHRSARAAPCPTVRRPDRRRLFKRGAWTVRRSSVP
ncbi:hypothetical protein [Actinomadura sp. GTD37]|uniref:hypothetical protein n=1 Tax=Actinomadura sp. GTD37 TaxID=1778030 RepID=UPI0035C040FB